MSSESKLGTVVFLFVLFLICVLLYGCPQYMVYEREMVGKSQLRESEWSRRIKVEEAKANLEAEKLNAQAEIERAKGVAEANKIIGESLKDNTEYLKYLWVKGLQDGSSEVIYIPTEANIPILESNRLLKPELLKNK